MKLNVCQIQLHVEVENMNMLFMNVFVCVSGARFTCSLRQRKRLLCRLKSTVRFPKDTVKNLVLKRRGQLSDFIVYAFVVSISDAKFTGGEYLT